TRLHEYVANLVDRTEPIDRSSSNEGASALDPVVGPEIDTAMSSAQQFLDDEDAGEGIEGDGDDMPFDSAGVTIPAKDRSHDAILRELEEMVGLDPVKEEINRVIAAQRLADLRRRRGLPTQDLSPHLVFVGNPGTGKTTVARLIGELYRSLGMLPSGHLVEADRSTLVAAYMGQTAIKTRQVCEKALGGVLFIDEAYSLVGERDQYGEECVNTLLQFMENHRGEFAVVVAGYPAEMYGFIESNPGLRARFDLFLEFPDYSTAELEQIFTGIAEKNDYVLSPGALAKVRAFIAAWPRWRGFGNGREVRKLFGDIARRHAELLFAEGDSKKVSTEALRTITTEAVPEPPEYRQPVAGVRYGDGGYL
ncbi:MAG: AAA family ATPase, partial [Actinobacteria bacterium]|nr:AAA family ATPase [Actinomycetota bacterium]